LIKAGEYEPYTSSRATDEIENEPNLEKQEKMASLIAEYGIKFLDVTDEVKRLTNLDIQAKAISPHYETDAAHIAVAAANGLDFIVSLNFTHIVRPWTIECVRRVNSRELYKGIGIYKPQEALEIYEDDSGLYE
jgi:predicted nucleic acid-binding protein